jgi:curved DNA-binding protein CbpA
MTNYQDPYQVLGLARNADEAAIKTAFRKLARQYHPDVNPGDPHADERFKAINHAYQTLTAPQKSKPATETRSHSPADNESYTDFHGRGRHGHTHYNPESLAILKSAFALTDKFNNYTAYLNYTDALYKIAQAQAARTPLRAFFNRLSKGSDYKAAETILNNLLKPEKILELHQDLKNILNDINNLHKTERQPDLNLFKQRITRLDQLIDRRFDILTSTLDFVAGKTDALKYRPKGPG